MRRAAEILTPPGQVAVVAPKRVDVLAHERSDVAQRFVINLMALGTSVGHDRGHWPPVPRYHGIRQDRYATKGRGAPRSASRRRHTSPHGRKDG